ncbi:hypothetical protein [Afifella aestuarii]|uniref:hypothetical protein n=1 Tax=Afifella aestuarii TaxID=1909496 RepID=UPI000FE2ABDF|nr:hypothetical protein [Afifella aestuarii]
MSDEMMWLIGLGVAFLGTLATIVGGAVMRDRQQSEKMQTTERLLSGKVEDGHEKLGERIREGDNRLDERINRVRDELAESYVRRVDLEGHIARLDSQLQELRSDGKAQSKEMTTRMDAQRQEMTQRFDALMAAIQSPRARKSAPSAAAKRV